MHKPQCHTPRCCVPDPGALYEPLYFQVEIMLFEGTNVETVDIVQARGSKQEIHYLYLQKLTGNQVLGTPKRSQYLTVILESRIKIM